MRSLELKKTLKLNCVCTACGKPFADEIAVAVSRRFLTEGEEPPRRGLMGAPDVKDLPAKNEEEARRLAKIDLRQETELLTRAVNERGELAALAPRGGAVCPCCGKVQPWLAKKNAPLTGAIIGALFGLALTVLLCIFWLKRPDIIIAIGLCGCFGYGGSRLALKLEAERVKKAVQTLPEAGKPKIETQPGA